LPTPVTPWTAQNPVTAKSLDLALYTSDGTGSNPTGIAFLAQPPVLFENFSSATTLHTNTSGSQSSLATSGSVTASQVIYDTAGYYGMSQDQPVTGYYAYKAAITGSAGDGVHPGGWVLLSHFAAVQKGATQTSISADMLSTAQSAVSGTRQAPSASADSTAFFLDLVSADSATWTPAVTIADSGSANAHLAVNTADPSGEACRFTAVWAAVSSTSSGLAVFDIGGSYPWTAPPGVTGVTVQSWAGGGGGGAGNATSGGVELGGGGGGGGEFATGTPLAVTPGNSYTVNVGAGGAGGASPGGGGNAGGNSVFAGDVANVTANGGSGGLGATTGINGSGGAGGTGAAGGTHHNGGAGAAGVTGKHGGGGGSSAGNAAAGNSATTAAGAPAQANGGPGGNGGQETISVIQQAIGGNSGFGSLTVKFKSALQTGSTVIGLVYHQSQNPKMTPTVKLNDGTPVADAGVRADVTATVTLQNGLYNAFNVPGGETSATITTDPGGGLTVIVASFLEVAGLGPSPVIDVSATHTQGPAAPTNDYTSNPGGTTPTNDAPEIWVGWTGAQSADSFVVHNPASDNGTWTKIASQYETSGEGVHAGCLGGYQIRTGTGNMHFNGLFSDNVTKGTFAAAYFTSAATPGAAPVTGPGGGGGAGLGPSGNGGGGSDGQVTLTWNNPSGSGYGTPPLPAPFANYSVTTTLGTGPGADVNINGNTGITDVLGFLSNKPVFRISSTSAQSMGNGASGGTALAFSGSTATVDNYTGWSAGTYTIPRDGLWLFHGLVAMSANSTGQRMAGAVVNGTTYWGPPSTGATTGTTNCGKTQVFALHAGDTVQLCGYQTSGGSLNTATTDQTRFLLAWLGEIGAPPALWAPPDATFRWQAGVKGENLGGNLSALMQQHLGNDLSFLAGPPYVVVAQHITGTTGLPYGSFSALTALSQVPLVHPSDNGDNYSGWDDPSNTYTAQVPGWYLCTTEMFAAPLASASVVVVAGLETVTSGGATPSQSPDVYQQLKGSSSSTIGGGAGGFGIVYLSAGETITPQIGAFGAAGTFNSNVGTVVGGFFGSHFEAIWLSN
jgi:hypothetical protein